MSFTPVSGAKALLKAAPAPSGSPATLPGMGWKLSIDPHLAEVSNFAVGRFKASTLEDADLTFTLVWDSTALPTDPAGAGIDAGLDILARLFVDDTRFYAGRFTVGVVGPGVEGLEGVVMYEVAAHLKGTLTRPIP